MIMVWERQIDEELTEAGVSEYVLSSSTDAEGNTIITMTIDERTANGRPEQFLSAIADVIQNNISITEALESREMFD